jgi:hypothetical protein
MDKGAGTMTQERPIAVKPVAAANTTGGSFVLPAVIADQGEKAAVVRAAKHIVKKGKAPVLKADQARELLDSIPLKICPEPQEGEEDKRPHSLIGLRDRSLVAVAV